MLVLQDSVSKDKNKRAKGNPEPAPNSSHQARASLPLSLACLSTDCDATFPIISDAACQSHATGQGAEQHSMTADWGWPAAKAVNFTDGAQAKASCKTA